MNTKTKIIKAAIDVISEKGYNETKMADIATLVGITAPSIYKHFKNKEDILFSIALANMIQLGKNIEHNLLGIKNPTRRIRQLIWTYLDYWQKDTKELMIFFFECRSNFRFYQSEAYQEFRKIARDVYGMIEDCKRSGEFDSSVNISIVRDLLFGTLDFSVLGCLLLKETESIIENFEDILKLFQNITRPKPTETSEANNKRDRLLDAALKIFAQKGYYGATISEIAKMAKVSDGIVYEYFTNKEDLLFSIANKKVQHDVAMLDQMLNIADPRRKLRQFIRYHCNLYLVDLDYAKLSILLIQANQRFYTKFGEDSYKAYHKVIMDLIIEGQERGVFKRDIHPRVFRNMILGGINYLFLGWFTVQQDRGTNKTDEINMITDLLCRAISV